MYMKMGYKVIKFLAPFEENKLKLNGFLFKIQMYKCILLDFTFIECFTKTVGKIIPANRG